MAIRYFFGVENKAAYLIDMNSSVVKHWEEILGTPIANRILLGGYVVGSTVRREGHQEFIDMVQVDWNGNIVWKAGPNYSASPVFRKPGQIGRSPSCPYDPQGPSW